VIAEQMKVVHVETGRHFYGGAQQVVWLMARLEAAGVDGVLVCPAGSGIDRVARQQGLPVRNIACGGDHDLGFVRRLRDFLRRERPDLVHCHSRRGADFLGGMAAWLAGVPAVLSRRVDSDETGWLARLRYRWFRRVIAISENVAASLESSGVPHERVVVIRSAVDSEQLGASPDCAEVHRRFGLREGDFAIAVIAQLIPRKGHKLLLDVIPNLRDVHPHIRFVLFGSGPSEDGLKALAEHLNLLGTVQFAGYHDDLDDYLACFDLLVHPALEEGLGVAMLKAAAAGLPVVAFNVAGSREAVADGKTGVLVPAGDVRLLQHAIALMIEDDEMRIRFGKAGRMRMMDEFSPDEMADRHIALYRSILDA
jgi:glycosyltransferase involved in cell wall biosynthesis